MDNQTGAPNGARAGRRDIGTGGARRKGASVDRQSRLPFGYDGRKALQDFDAEQNLGHEAHMERVDYAAQIPLATGSPSEMRVDYENVLDVDPFDIAHFLQFKPIEKRFVNAVRDATAERGRVIIFFDFPCRDKVYGGEKARPSKSLMRDG